MVRRYVDRGPQVCASHPPGVLCDPLCTNRLGIAPDAVSEAYRELAGDLEQDGPETGQFVRSSDSLADDAIATDDTTPEEDERIARGFVSAFDDSDIIAPELPELPEHATPNERPPVKHGGE